MKLDRHRRSFAAVVLVALAALLLTSVAFAGSGPGNNRKHRQHGRQHARQHQRQNGRQNQRQNGRQQNRGQNRRQAARHRTFAPEAIVKAAEVSAVELDPLTQQFMQVTFDRGRITAVSSSSITLEQKQDAAVWRTQTFTVPSSAVITLNGKSTMLGQLPTGVSARVESSGAVGGTLTVVRVNAYRFGEAPLPAAS